jgi:hypothetical protein
MPDEIEEFPPGPEQPDAIGVRERMPRVTISAIGLTMQADIGGVTLAFERQVDAAIDAPDLDQEIKFVLDRIGVARARGQLAEKLLAREIATDMLASWADDRERSLKAQADEHIRLRASFQAAHDGSGKRGAWFPNRSEQEALSNAFANIETRRNQFDENKRKLEQDVRLVDKQIARLSALISGRDPTEEPASLAQAAE